MNPWIREFKSICLNIFNISIEPNAKGAEICVSDVKRKTIFAALKIIPDE